MSYRQIMLLVLLSSCNIYNSSFDCPPGEGIGCAPVGEVLDLIVERESGEDLFVEDKGTALLIRQTEEGTRQPMRTSRKKLILIRDESGNLQLAQTPEEGS